MNSIKKTTEATVINRREIEPFQIKACKAVESYEKSVGCGSFVVGNTGDFINMSNERRSANFCEVCRACYPDSTKRWKDNEYPCSTMHNEIHAQVRTKSSYIYTCEIGFAFWTSPLYTRGRYAGSLASGHTLTVPKKEAVQLFCSRYEAKQEKVMDLMSDFPEKSHDEVSSLAQLLLVCAEKLSSGMESQIMGNIITGGNNYKNNLKEKKFYPLQAVNTQDKERMLLAALKRGDLNTASKTLIELFSIIKETNPNNIEYIRSFLIELAVLLSRTAVETPKMGESYIRCLGRIRESKTIEDLNSNLNCIVDSLGPWIFSFRGIRHSSALRRAERFIWNNYDKRLSLNEIAAASGLSAPYFSTIFKKEMGKNLSTYLNELRVNKAITYLDENKLSLNEIAKVCGFEDQSWFSKIFKSHMGLSPGKYRDNRETEAEK